MNPNLLAAINIAAFVGGQLLVTHKRWTGFLVWAGSNILVAGSCLAEANHATACMFLAYFAANLCSMFAWFRSTAGPSANPGFAPPRSLPPQFP